MSNETRPDRRSFIAATGATLALAACPAVKPAPAPSASQPPIAMRVRRAAERGRANHGWLDTRHTFSFANYYDPAHMGFRQLRVINDDRVAAGAGFPTHPHRDMEIISYVVQGALQHKDSMGNGSVIRPGDVQRMSAGTGVTHSEFNPSPADAVHFLQIWIQPEQRGLKPSYEQRHFGDQRRGKLQLVASRDGRGGALRIHQDVSVYAAVLAPKDVVEHDPGPGRHVWIQVVEGELRLGPTLLASGDGAALEHAPRLSLQATKACEFLLFDLA